MYTISVAISLQKMSWFYVADPNKYFSDLSSNARYFTWKVKTK